MDDESELVYCPHLIELLCSDLAAAKRFGGHLIIGDRIRGDHTKGAKLTVRLPEVRP